MKRKVLISVLAIALVLTLCIGIFAACDPKKAEYTVTYSLGEFEGTGTAPAAQEVEEGSKIKLPAVEATWEGYSFAGWKAGADGELLAPGTEVEVKADITYTAQWEKYKVTVYGPDGTKLGDEIAVEWEGKYSIYNPALNFELEAAQGTYFTYQLYDPATQQTKGAFDYTDFEASGNITIKIVAESVGTVAENIDAKWRGQFILENMSGEVSEVEVKSTAINLTLVNGMDTIEASGSMLKSTVWTKDGRFIIEYAYSFPEDPETFYTYYAFSLSADNNTLTVSNLSDPEIDDYIFTRKPEITVTVHYTLNGTEKTVTMNTVSLTGKSYKMLDPLGYDYDENYDLVPVMKDTEDLNDALALGECYSYYFYNADAADKKGEAFDFNKFEATANVDIIIIKESVGAHATSIDQSWYGVYIGTDKYDNECTLEISGDNSGTIMLDEDSGTVGAGGTIFTADGKLILAIEGYQGYSYNYFTKNADGTITMESDSGNVTFTKCNYINVTINYNVGGQPKTATVKALDTDKDGVYTLSDEPAKCLSEDAYNELLNEYKLGQKFAYYYYNNSQKGAAFDWEDFKDTQDFSVLIEIETFATAVNSIDTKFGGTFKGTHPQAGAFTLTIDTDKKTAKLEYDDNPYPTEFSIEDGTILLTTDGQLVLASNTMPQYATYYYIAENSGTYTLKMYSPSYGQESDLGELTKTGGGIQATDPYAGTTWTGKASDANALSIKFEFSADGTVTITIGSYTPLKGKYTYENGDIKVTNVEDTDAMGSVEVTITNPSDTSMKVRVSYEDQDSYDTLIKEAELTKAAA